MSKKVEVDFKKYYKYDELTAVLGNLAKKYPKLTDLVSMGKSPQGRDFWVIKITNKGTGSAEDKPAFWIDGNTHASEVTGSALCLYTIWYLLTNYGKDRFVTDLLDTRSIYVNPRIDVDGTELYLTTPLNQTGGARFYPYDEEEWSKKEGLYEDDVDADGHIVQMRIEDPLGDWKVSDEDPRLMAKRKAGEEGGVYYRIYPEGMMLNYDGGEIKMAPPKYGLNLNRNCPANFLPHPQQSGAGPYPLSEPEQRALADFLKAHPNVAGRVSYHTTGGMLFRPFSTKTDRYFLEKGIKKDLDNYEFLGKICVETTAYPPVQSFQEGESPRYGDSDDFYYEYFGIYDVCLELWDLAGRVGLGNYVERGGAKFDWNEEKKGLVVLRWIDTETKGVGFIDWKSFNHPQLGPVEIGGIMKYVMNNPPPEFLEDECRKDFMFALKFASLLPLVRVSEVRVTPVGDKTSRVQATIENRGFFPTYVSELAVKSELAKPVRVEIELSEGVSLVGGRKWVEIPHLQGGSERIPGVRWYRAALPERSRKTVEWLVKAEKPAIVKVKAISEKAGIHSREVKISKTP